MRAHVGVGFVSAAILGCSGCRNHADGVALTNANASDADVVVASQARVAAVDAAAETDEADAGSGDLTREVLPWPDQTHAAAVLAYLRSASSLAATEASVSLVEVASDGGLGRRLAEVRLSAPPDGCTEPANDADATPPLKLDLGPFPIAEGERAIGVRWTCAETFPAGEAEKTHLYLLRRVADRLDVIFDAEVEDHEIQRGPNDASESSTKLSFANKRTNGHSDIVLTTRLQISSLTPDPTRKPVTRSTTRTFTWAVDRYVKKT